MICCFFGLKSRWRTWSMCACSILFVWLQFCWCNIHGHEINHINPEKTYPQVGIANSNSPKQDLEFRSQGPTSCSNFGSQMHGKNSQFFQLEDRISSNVRVRTGDKRLGFDLLLLGKRWPRKSLNLWSGKEKGFYFIERRSQHCTETSVAVATWFMSCGSQQPEAMWLSSPADANPWTWQLQPQETKS